MPLSPGTRIGTFEISDRLGVGGMGEVYRARDLKLGRDVAIKVLPELFAQDSERLGRFEREAKVLASLNHPNIAHLYGVEDAGSVHALVMELVDGPTLADRIAQGRLPVKEALRIARQVADALETAHDQGIIHRDLKPANIKVRDDGTVKVLDFGLAKALTSDPNSSMDAMNSPTLTARATQLGVILGTAAYMAPEQAKGKTVDRRADIWAFGSVLFEMLSGRRAFEGEDISDTLASVLKEEPNWSAVPADVPAPVLQLLHRCLEKDPKLRLRSIGDAPFDLDDTSVSVVSMPAPTLHDRPGRLPWVWLIAAALAGAAVAAGVFLLRPHASAAGSVTRLSVLPPPDISLQADSVALALSPDGRSVVFTGVTASGATGLWIRPLDSTDSRFMAGTENGLLPFWSPDSKQIGFFADGKLKKLAAAGGSVEVLCDAKDPRGGSWSASGAIVFAPSSSRVLQTISANGGDPKPITTLDASRGETGHRFPWFLPDGKHFLYASLPAHDGKSDIKMGSLEGGQATLVTSSESGAIYAPGGHLLFVRKNVLVAQPFDAARGQVIGEAVSLGDTPGGVGNTYAAGLPGSVSDTGAIAYLASKLSNTNLAWFDATGRQIGTLSAPPGRYTDLRIAPDGRHVAAIRAESATVSDVWIFDLDHAGALRLTNGPGLHMFPVWSPDSRTVAFARMFSGPRDIFKRIVDGASPEESVLKNASLFKDPFDWSPDGRFIVYGDRDPQTQVDLWVMPIQGGSPTIYRRTPYAEAGAVISPDGRWLAFVADESGRNEVYVESFPTPGEAVQVTTGGAAGARWRADGKQLEIVSGDGRTLLLADVDTSSSGRFRASPPKTLSNLPKNFLAADTTRDLKRLLVAVPVDDAPSSSVTVVLNWASTLKK